MEEDVLDFDRAAAAFDAVLPMLAPVADRIADRLGPLAPGTVVLDIACGTGEPGFTLLERRPGVRLLGVDRSALMTSIAAKKAAARGLLDVRYEIMDSRHLELPDCSVDAVTSRFGLLSFVPDPAAEARQLARVLRPGGTFCVAVWDAGSRNIISYALSVALREWLAPPLRAAVERQEHCAMPGRREAWLERAGLADVRSEPFGWPVAFADDVALWEFATGPVFLGELHGQLDPGSLAQARGVFFELLSDYRRPAGAYVLPYACRILTGSR